MVLSPQESLMSSAFGMYKRIHMGERNWKPDLLIPLLVEFLSFTGQSYPRLLGWLKIFFLPFPVKYKENYICLSSHF